MPIHRAPFSPVEVERVDAVVDEAVAGVERELDLAFGVDAGQTAFGADPNAPPVIFGQRRNRGVRQAIVGVVHLPAFDSKMRVRAHILAAHCIEAVVRGDPHPPRAIDVNVADSIASQAWICGRVEGEAGLVAGLKRGPAIVEEEKAVECRPDPLQAVGTNGDFAHVPTCGHAEVQLTVEQQSVGAATHP